MKFGRDDARMEGMTITAALPLLVCIVGAVLYFATQGKPSQAGLYAFAVGLLAFLLQSGRTVHF